MAKSRADRQLADDALAIERAKAAVGTDRKTGQPKLVQTEYRIAGLRGFTLRVEPNGHATYWVRYSVRKIERRIRVGVRGLMPYRDAKIAAREQLLAIDKGADPVATKHERAQTMTFAELWERRKHDNLDNELTPGTVTNYDGALRKYVFKTIGEKKIADVTADDVRVLLDAIRDTKGKLRRNPHNATLTAVASTFTWALGKGFVTANPTQHLRPLPASPPRKRSLSAEELGRLWNAIGTAPGINPKARLALRVLFLTGQRADNITGARIDWMRPNLDVANPVMVVPAAEMKVKTDDHMLPLAPAVVALFKEAIALGPSSEFIFSSAKSSSGHLSRFAIPEAMEAVCKHAGIGNVHAHDFRHLSNTWLAEQQVRKDVRDKITHHGVSRVEHTYNSARLLQPVRDALSKWIRHVEAAARAAGSNEVPNNASASA
jgi:integrase